MEEKKYYLGLDIGTDSVGFCVTDRDYNIVRKHKVIQYGDHSDYHGNHLWGSRLFDEAETAASRRMARESRRRYQRRKWRIILLQNIFKPEMDKIDPFFFDRLNNSAVHLEDRKEELRDQYLLFNEDYSDKDFYEEYPTIYHLRLDMINHPEKKFDLRLVYLAFAHMIKYRGNFLTEGELSSIGNDPSTVQRLFDELNAIITSINEESELTAMSEIPCDDKIAVQIIDAFKRISKKGEIYDALVSKFNLTGMKSTDFRASVFKLISGSKIALGKLFADLEAEPEILKVSVDFAKEDFMDVDLPKLTDDIGAERISLIQKIKEIYDLRILCHLLNGKKYVSEAMVGIYDSHKKQLAELKNLIRKYNPSKYSAFFRKMTGKPSYAGYIGYTDYNSKKITSNHMTSLDDLYKEIKTILPLDSFDKPDFVFKSETDFDEFKDIRDAIDAQSLLLRQNSKDNGVLPYQLNLIEMREILKNQGQYYPFLLEMDKDFNNPEKQSFKIESILKFKIPYYVGPLSDDEGINKWVQKKQTGVKITPWNFHDVIDEEKTAQAFMENLKNYCTYLMNEPTLARHSLYYSMFILLNEMNKWYVNEAPIFTEDKAYLVKEVYFKVRKPSKKMIEEALKRKYGQSVKFASTNGLTNEEKGAKDEDFHANLSSWIDMLNPQGFSERLLHEPALIDKAEDIIYTIAMFEDKSLVRKSLEKMGLTAGQIKYFSGLKYDGWGKLSKKLLCGLKEEKVNNATGEVLEYSILDEMWLTNSNFMELYEKEGSAFKKQVEECNAALQEKPEDLIDQEYTSPMMKRALRQTIKIVDELKRILHIDSFDSYFVESTRSEGEKKRTKSRKKQLQEILESAKKFKSEMDDEYFKSRIERLSKELEARDEDELKGKRLFLYFMQLGRSVYTGEEISLDDLSKEYDIDHIIPQSKVKDDSFTNTVLVERGVNNKKQDQYPIPKDILTNKGIAWIRTLNSLSKLSSVPLMPDMKMKRLLRSINKPLTDEDLSGFVKRQLVSTSQSVKAVCDVLKAIDPKAKIVYSKAGLVSEFRAEFGLVKSRDLNDFHHAHDAYLNIVVGNVYNKVFSTGNPDTIRYRKEHFEGFNMDLGYIFRHDQRVYQKDTLIWKAKRYDENGNELPDGKGTIDLVRKSLGYHDIVVTRMMVTNVGKQGFFNKISIHSAKAGDASYPLKTSGPFACEDYAKKYGGYSDLTNPYASLVKSEGKKGKTAYSLEYVPTIVRKSIGSDQKKLEEYLVQNNGLKKPEILIEKLLKYTIVRIPTEAENGKKGMVRVAITGKTGNSLICINQTQLILPNQYVRIVKRISNLLGTNLSAGQKKDLTFLQKYGKEDIHIDKKNDITRKECEELFDYLVKESYTRPEFEGLPKLSPTIKKLKAKKEAFVELNTLDMAKTLSIMIKMLSCKSALGLNLNYLADDLPSAFGNLVFSKMLTPGTQIIQTSTTGLFERVLFTVPEE